MEEEKEHFCVRFLYLKTETSVKTFFEQKLPKHINSWNKEKIRKGIETYYDTYDVTYEQDFTTTRPLSIEDDLCHVWFSNKPSSEKVAWMEIKRKKRAYPDSARNDGDLSFRDVRVIGGSMISPVTFVPHWELSTNYQNCVNVIFQGKSSKMIIEKCVSFNDYNGNSFTLEITYESLYNTIIVEKTGTSLFILLNLKSNPKIYENAGRSRNNSRAIAIQTGFNDLGSLNTYYLEFDTTRHTRTELESVLSRFICVGFHVAYTGLQIVKAEAKFLVFPPDSFEVAYAWECVQSVGYKLNDQLTTVITVIKQLYLENTTLTSHIFYELSSRLLEKPFFSLKQELNLVINKKYKTAVDYECPAHYSMVPRLVLTPTKLLYLPKQTVFQNRILRQYGEEFFIRVVIRDEDFEKLNTVQANALDPILERMKTFFKEGFEINDRHFEFLGCSNSQLREHSFWFFHPHDGIASEIIRNSSGELWSEKCVASYVSRFGLCFSSTRKTVDVDESCVKYIEDVKNDKYCFTDGIGCISPHLAKRVANELHINPVPSAFQIRFGGCKGVVAQAPTLGNEQDLLCIGESMKKFDSNSHNLEILEITRPGRLHLNRQVITLLSGLGIPDDVFLKLQERMLIDMADMLLYDEKALIVLLESTVNMDFSRLANGGISFVQEPFFRSLLHSIYHHKLTNLMKRTRIQIPLEKGRYMMGTSDETKTLKPGQVFIQYSKETHRPGENVNIVNGVVAVTKNPCFHEGDIRVFQAVNESSLSHMVDCIVFPQNGGRPHPDEMSGSDLDGDMYFVCWDEELCKFKNQIPMDFPKANKKLLTRSVTSHDIIDFVADYIRHDKLGLIANAHLVQADKTDIFSDECHKLAKLHSDAVDFPKTGQSTKIDDELRPKTYPDFMMKSDKEMYPSSKCIGKLFGQCRSLQRMHKQKKNKVDIDRDFSSYKIDDETINKARHQKYLYDTNVSEVLDLHGIKTATEAITGLVCSFKLFNGCLKDEKFQDEKLVKEKMAMIQNRTRKIFFLEFGGESNASKEDPEVLAWYQVTYSEVDPVRKILSFPWIVADVLIILKESRDASPASKLGSFLKVHYDECKKYMTRNLISLNQRKENIKSLLKGVQKRQFKLTTGGLEDFGLLKSQPIFNIAIEGLYPREIREIMKKKGIVNVNFKGLRDPCYLVANDEKEMYMRFITDPSIVALNRTMQGFLSKNSTSLIHIVQFLYEILQEVFSIDSDAYSFLDVISAVIVYYCLPSCERKIFAKPSTADELESGKYLLFILRKFILCFRSMDLGEHPVLKEGFDALNISSSVISTIADTLMMAYQKIAQHNDATSTLSFE